MFNLMFLPRQKLIAPRSLGFQVSAGTCEAGRPQCVTQNVASSGAAGGLVSEHSNRSKGLDPRQRLYPAAPICQKFVECFVNIGAPRDEIPASARRAMDLLQCGRAAALSPGGKTGLAGQQGQNWALDFSGSAAFPEVAAAKSSRNASF